MLLVVVGLFNLPSILFFKSCAVPVYPPLSSLLSKLLGSLKITMNIGATNISCLINALKEAAGKPSYQEIPLL